MTSREFYSTLAGDTIRDLYEVLKDDFILGGYEGSLEEHLEMAGELWFEIIFLKPDETDMKNLMHFKQKMQNKKCNVIWQLLV